MRNAVDHGIEAPEARVAAGKPPAGTITLRASQRGGNIVIEVQRRRPRPEPRTHPREAPRERGISCRPTRRTPRSGSLIFAPGFSTAEEVTDVSGRGVGMDVVQRNIQSLGGTVEIDFAPKATA